VKVSLVTRMSIQRRGPKVLSAKDNSASFVSPVLPGVASLKLA
jgi:hypothetical protein